MELGFVPNCRIHYPSPPPPPNAYCCCTAATRVYAALRYTLCSALFLHCSTLCLHCVYTALHCASMPASHHPTATISASRQQLLRIARRRREGAKQGCVICICRLPSAFYFGPFAICFRRSACCFLPAAFRPQPRVCWLSIFCIVSVAFCLALCLSPRVCCLSHFCIFCRSARKVQQILETDVQLSWRGSVTSGCADK